MASIPIMKPWLHFTWPVQKSYLIETCALKRMILCIYVGVREEAKCVFYVSNGCAGMRVEEEVEALGVCTLLILNMRIINLVKPSV